MFLYKQTNELKTVNHLSKKGWKVIGYSTTIDPRYNNINHHYLLEKPEDKISKDYKEDKSADLFKKMETAKNEEN